MKRGAATTLRAKRRGLGAEFRDGVTVRAAVLVIGVALLQLGFIASYVGAFGHPTPHRLPLAVVAPFSVQAKVVSELNAVAGSPLAAVAVPTVAAGRADLLHRTAYGVFVVDAVGSVDGLLEASASGVSAATAMTDVMQGVEAHVHRTVVVDDIRPPLLGDHNSLTSFYLVIGWIIGGYLAAAMLGVSSGSRPANVNRATVRLSAMALYAVVTGLLGAVIVGPWLHSLPDHLLGLWLLGSLLIFCTGAFTIGLQVMAGTVGIGIAILIFVVLGNPSAGGAYTWQLLPKLWRVIGPWIPNGAGTSAARGIAYFGSTGVTTDYLVIIGYGVAGLIATYGVLFYVGHQLVHLVGDDEDNDDERLMR